MAGNYWIKLYLDILDDSKMAILPDRLWRRVVELFLVAGRYNQAGGLPDTERLAWDLRLSAPVLELELKEIEKTGIINRSDSGWFVVSYSKRQAPTPHVKRQQSYRERIHGDQYAGPGPGPVPSPLDAPVPEGERPPLRHELIFNLYEDLCGSVPELLVPELLQASKDYPADRIEFAFKTAADHGAKNWLYVRKVLENKNGRPRPGHNALKVRDPEKYQGQDRSLVEFDGDHAIPGFGPIVVASPALLEARINWQKLAIVADNKGLHELVVRFYPGDDSDWRSIDSAAGMLGDELRKVQP
jgi:hypothetical protein